jgi:formylglycine-generating enzyme required for sulfatase activity
MKWLTQIDEVFDLTTLLKFLDMTYKLITSAIKFCLILTGLVFIFTQCIKKEITYEDPNLIDAPDEINLNTLTIPGGTFTMGSPATEPYHQLGNAEQHEVTVDTFIMSVFEITNTQFATFLNEIGIGSYPVYPEGEFPDQVLIYGPEGLTFIDDEYKIIAGYEDHPVTFVSWFGAYEFARYVGGRLPTEAEWEYAARAGTNGPFSTGACLHNTEANYYWNKPYTNCENSVLEGLEKTEEVGTYPPNAFGLYNMHGNVKEWCNDWFGIYPTEPQHNPTGPENGEYRIVRGGSFVNEAGYCRSAHRQNLRPDIRQSFIGFRVAFYP